MTRSHAHVRTRDHPQGQCNRPPPSGYGQHLFRYLLRLPQEPAWRYVLRSTPRWSREPRDRLRARSLRLRGAASDHERASADQGHLLPEGTRHRLRDVAVRCLEHDGHGQGRYPLHHGRREEDARHHRRQGYRQREHGHLRHAGREQCEDEVCQHRRNAQGRARARRPRGGSDPGQRARRHLP